MRQQMTDCQAYRLSTPKPPPPQPLMPHQLNPAQIRNGMPTTNARGMVHSRCRPEARLGAGAAARFSVIADFHHPRAREAAGSLDNRKE